MEQPPPPMVNFEDTDIDDFMELFYRYFWFLPNDSPARGIDFLLSTFADLPIGDCGYALNHLKKKKNGVFQTLWAKCRSATPSMVEELYDSLCERVNYHICLQAFLDIYDIWCRLYRGRHSCLRQFLFTFAYALRMPELKKEFVRPTFDDHVELLLDDGYGILRWGFHRADRLDARSRVILFRLFCDRFPTAMPLLSAYLLRYWPHQAAVLRLIHLMTERGDNHWRTYVI